jgi:hypothetical protein
MRGAVTISQEPDESIRLRTPERRVLGSEMLSRLFRVLLRLFRVSEQR